MDEDEMSREERLWFAKLKRTLRDMPASVEIQVHSNSIQMNRAGAREDHFRQRGHADGVESLDWFRTKRVYPCSEST